MFSRSLALTLVLALPATAWADDDATLTRLLLAHHEAPTRAEIERHIASPKPRLVAWALDAQLFPPLRKRAIAVLAEWGDAEVEDTYRALLVRRDARVMHHVTFAFSRAFPVEAPAVLGPLLDGEDRELALSAVDALVRVDTPAARLRLDAVRTPAVRARIGAARRALEKSRRH